MAINIDSFVSVPLQSFHKDDSTIGILILNTIFVRNKAMQPWYYITHQNLDIVALTET